MAKWQHPFPVSTITSVFGTTRNRTNPHRGTDYAPKANALIPAVTAGAIVSISWSQCLGWVVVQSCSCSDHTGKHYIGYCHLSCTKHGINCDGSGHDDGSTCMKNLKTGDTVRLGQPVGRVGNTGDCSRGAHLHITLGTKAKSVFYGKVYDIRKFIDNKIAEEPKPKKVEQPAQIETAECPPKPTNIEPSVSIATAAKNGLGRFWTLLWR